MTGGRIDESPVWPAPVCSTAYARRFDVRKPIAKLRPDERRAELLGSLWIRQIRQSVSYTSSMLLAAGAINASSHRARTRHRSRKYFAVGATQNAGLQAVDG